MGDPVESNNKSIMSDKIIDIEPSKKLQKSIGRIGKGLRFTAYSDLDPVVEDVEQINARKFTCSICKKPLSTKDTLRRHILSIHIKLKPFECTGCDKKFVLEKALKAHKKIHEEIPHYVCHCGEKYKVESSYKDHIRRLHQAVPSTKFVCNNCDKIFYDGKTLRTHLKAVHKPKTIECTYPSCNKVFSTISLMHAHFRCHSEECKVCSECGKSFKSERYLQKHKLTHEGVRLFSCNECFKTYLSTSHLTQHRKRAHSVADKFQCVFCGKCFSAKEQLTYHENAHQGEKPFMCDICGYQTGYRNTLYSHRKNVHSKPIIFESSEVVSCKSSIKVKLFKVDSISTSEKRTSTNSKQTVNFKKTSQKVSQKDLLTNKALDLQLKTKLKKKKKVTMNSVKSVEEDNLVTVNSNETSSLSLVDSLLKSSPMDMFWDCDGYSDWVNPAQSSSESTIVVKEEILLNQPNNIFPKGRLSGNATLNCTAVDSHSDVEDELSFNTPFYDF